MKIIQDLISKKALMTLPLVISMGIAAGTASANSLAYTDFYNAGGITLGGTGWSATNTDSWKFNISDNHGFDTATHTVTSATIDLNLRDDKKDFWGGKLEFFNLTAGGETSAVWQVTNGTVTLEVTSLISLNLNGTLDVTLTATQGDFYFDNATLNAQTSVVPVPAAVWLFGSGLLGLVGMARRQRRSC